MAFPCDAVLGSFRNQGSKAVYVIGTTHIGRISTHILGQVNHIQLVRHVMRLFTINSDRLPMVFLLSGLLLNAAGLYVGLEHSLAIAGMIVGWLCCAFGVVLFVLQLLEHPQKPGATRLSSKFISAGSTVIMPVVPNGENEQAAE